MLEVTEISKLKKPCKKMPNILSLDIPGLGHEGKQLFIAPIEICHWMQNLINSVHDHRCLKEAQILPLIKVAQGDTKKLKNGERIKAGSAAIPSATGKLLSRMGEDAAAADFVVTLSGDWLRSIGIMDDEFKMLDADVGKVFRAIALIDHELSHCSPKISGEYIDPKMQAVYIKSLSGRLIEVRKDVTNDDGDELVRFYAINKKNKFDWQIRKHDVTEFNGTVARFGAWDSQIGRFVDEIKKSQPGLFDNIVHAA